MALIITCPHCLRGYRTDTSPPLSQLLICRYCQGESTWNGTEALPATEGKAKLPSWFADMVDDEKEQAVPQKPTFVEPPRRLQRVQPPEFGEVVHQPEPPQYQQPNIVFNIGQTYPPVPFSFNGMAVASFAIGIATIPVSVMSCLGVIVGLPMALIGLLLGIMAYFACQSGEDRGLGLSIAGMAINGVIVVAWVGVLVFAIRVANVIENQQQQLRETQQKQLKELQQFHQQK